MSESFVINNVPLLDLEAQYQTIKEDIRIAIGEIIESQKFIMGQSVSKLEERIAQYSHTKYGIACASGSDALLLSLMALKIQPGDLVLTTPYTFFATAGAVARLGAIPVFLDINPIDYNLDPNQLESFLNGEHSLNEKFGSDISRVKAIIPVHLYGQCADMDPILEIAKKFDLPVIEDAAQAIGAQYKGNKAGNMGDTGCFSFFPSKNLGGYGDGGMITSNRDDLTDLLRILRLHGSRPKYHHKIVGINSRLDSLQAAILNVKLDHLDDWSDERRKKALNYNRLFEKAGVVIDNKAMESGQIAKALKNEPDKLLPPVETTGDPNTGGRHIYHQYVIRTEKRDYVQEQLSKANIGSAIYYPISLHEQECFSDLGYKTSDCQHAYDASKQTLALPVYPELSEDQQEFVVQHVVKVLEEA